jgi:hypothetical protein
MGGRQSQLFYDIVAIVEVRYSRRLPNKHRLKREIDAALLSLTVYRSKVFEPLLWSAFMEHCYATKLIIYAASV